MSGELFVAVAVFLMPWSYIIVRIVSSAYFSEKLAYQRQLLQSLTRGEKVNG